MLVIDQCIDLPSWQTLNYQKITMLPTNIKQTILRYLTDRPYHIMVQHYRLLVTVESLEAQVRIDGLRADFQNATYE